MKISDIGEGGKQFRTNAYLSLDLGNHEMIRCLSFFITKSIKSCGNSKFDNA